jgi:protein involved in polysaccharide export with SLBB domain
MSPEQTRGRDIDPRSDFFSLGCLLYQCLTGVLPFKSENVLATLQSVQMLSPTTPEDLDPSVDRDLSSLVMTLLEKSPTNRPSHANDISVAFAEPCSKWNFTPAKKHLVVSSSSLDSKTDVNHKSAGWWPLIACVMAFGLCLAYFFLPQVIRVATNQGQIVIESNDPDVQIEVLKGGERIEIMDLKTRQRLDIVAGEYQIRPIGNQNEISIDKQSVAISRGSEVIVRVWKEGVLATDRSPDRNVGPYLLDSGDILGVFIENVLGEFGSAPPVQVPPAGSGLPPSIGFPVVVMEDGKISLPLIEDLPVRGKTLKEAKKAIEDAYRGGEEPILISKKSRIIVTMSRKRGYQPPAMSMPGSIAKAAAQFEAAKADYGGAKDASAANFSIKQQSDQAANDSAALTTDESPERNAGPYLLDTGDILGVFIENVLGEFGSAPPVHVPPAGSGHPPSIGFPIAVREDGTISLPLIEDLSVRGLTIQQAEGLIERAYKGGEKPILIKRGRIIVTMSRKRGYQPHALRIPGSIAMAAAQFEAAKAEYGSDHPFVTHLRSKLETALLANDQPKQEVSGLEKVDSESQDE